VPELTTNNSLTNQAKTKHGYSLVYWRYVLAACSGLLMALPTIEPRLYILSWFGLVPLLFAVRDLSLRQCYLVSLASGLVLYLCSSYWVFPFISSMKGYGVILSTLVSSLYWVYSAQAIALVMLLWKLLSRNVVWERVLLFPLLLVATYSIFPSVLPVQFGLGQSHVLLAIQATDILGIYGLDFALALSNICIFELLRLRYSKSSLLSFLLPVLFFSLWFSYGYFSLEDWERRQQGWATKKIGLVQPNDAASIAIPEPKTGYGWSYPPEMEMTEQLVKAGAEVVFWPESRYKGYFDSGYVRAAYLHRVKQLKTPLIMQDLEYVNSRASDSGSNKTYNTLFMLSAKGELVSFYRKQKRIAFGEYIPLIDDSPAMRSWAQVIIGDFLAKISEGKGRQTFSAAGMNIIPLICFEVIFPKFVADAVVQSPSGGVLLAASFDAWFGQTHAPFQHLALSRIRAVENRLPLVHLINNGPSGVVMPSGRIIAQTEAFSKLAVTVDMPYSEHLEASVFSTYPRAFIYCVYGVLLMMVIKRVYVRRLKLSLSKT